MIKHTLRKGKLLAVALALLALTAAPTFAQSIPDPNPVGPTIGLCQSGASVALTGATTETVLATCNIARKAMGPKGRVVVTLAVTHTNSANTKTIRVRLNGVAGTAYLTQVNTTSATYKATVRISNRGATNSQTGYADATVPTYVTSAIDTTVLVPLVITGQLQSGAETLTLESYDAVLVPSK